ITPLIGTSLLLASFTGLPPCSRQCLLVLVSRRYRNHSSWYLILRKRMRHRQSSRVMGSMSTTPQEKVNPYPQGISRQRILLLWAEGDRDHLLRGGLCHPRGEAPDARGIVHGADLRAGLLHPL